MKIFIKTKPESKSASIEKTGNFSYLVSVREPAKQGKANQAVISALAKHFGVNKSKIRIIIGANLRNKIIEISQ